jgi:predicted DsbA family dithiol-disulfide isomerase
VLVEIYSDIVCPWCYIGQHQFGLALERSPRAGALETVFRAFQLDPQARTEPTPVWDAYARKFGGEDAAAAVIGRITGAAAGVGLELRLDRALRVNTFDAHRLVWFGGEGAGQWAVERALLEAYLVEGRNVADRPTLVAIGEECGLDPAAVETFLAGKGGVAEVQAEIASAADRDVLGVPTFFLASQVGIPGAQDPETFVKVIDRAVTRLATN